METPKFPAIPKALLKKGQEDLQEHRGYYYYHQKLIHEQEKDRSEEHTSELQSR